ncbi:TonB-dependent receptor [Lunatimonas lonarensis]|uniref:TonB-dependent receptor n=1 Tax=Lunatimonas lonarensis TaxID=1232681 RepID=R7ZWH1_9BACT|nr:TonB-dependent receptor [Lunatimonas lonarensis]EON78495.1 TonB-dependent receptor [Lunatimonas lonarensis]
MKFFLTILFGWLLGVTLAQTDTNTLTGTVLDNTTKEPIPGVTVFVAELNRGTVTDLDGRFTLTLLPSREITVQFTFVGYSTGIIKTRPSSRAQLVVSLEQTTTTVDEVVVSGAYVMSRESSPISIEKISKDDILRAPAPSLMSALARTPGVSEISLGPGISKPVIRGLSFSRVLSVYQGARFENQQWGADHGLGMTETGIGSIEMVKGPASIIYGSGAMAGVVHLIEDKDASTGEIDGDLTLRGYGNSLGGRIESGVKGASQGGLLWSLRAASESHADYLDGDGNAVGNTRFSTQNLKAGLGLQRKWGDTRIRYTYLAQRLGILEEDEMDELVTTRNDRNLQLPFQDVKDHFLNSETNLFVGQDRLKIILGYHWNFRQEVEDDFDEVDLGLNQQNFMYDIKYFKGFGEHTEVIFGIQGFYLQNTNQEAAAEILIPDATKDDRSIYSLVNFNKNEWVVQGGLRYDFRKVVADASRQKFVDYGFLLPGEPASRQLTSTFDGVTASAGATFRPDSKWRARMNVASGFRAPDLAELYSNGPHPGTSRFERGNAEFGREQNIQGDLGLRYQAGDFSVSAEAFYNHVNNYIFFAPTGENVGDLMLWKFEQDNARLYGGETLVEIHPKALKWLSGSSSYSMVIGTRRSDQSYLPYIPAFRWNNDMTFQLKDMPSLQRPYIGLSGMLVLDQNRAADMEDTTPGYFLLGINVGASLKIGAQQVDTYINGTNLLGKTYLDHMSLYRPLGIHQIGRNVSLNLKMSF